MEPSLRGSLRQEPDMYFNAIAALIAVVVGFPLLLQAAENLGVMFTGRKGKPREFFLRGYPRQILQIRAQARDYEKLCYPPYSRAYWLYNLSLLLFFLGISVVSALYAVNIISRFVDDFYAAATVLGLFLGGLPFLGTGWYRKYQPKSKFRKYHWLLRHVGSPSQLLSLYLVGRSCCGDKADRERFPQRMVYGARFFLVPGSIVFSVVPVSGCSPDAIFLWIFSLYCAGITALQFVWLWRRSFPKAKRRHSPCHQREVLLLLSDIGEILRL